MAVLLAAGVVIFAVADLVIAEHSYVDVAKRIGGAARIGIVGQAVLGAQFAIDLIEDDAEFAGIIGEKHGATSCFGDGLQGVLAGGVAPVFVFYGANQNRVEQSVRANSCFASGVKIGAARGLASVGDEDDDVA